VEYVAVATHTPTGRVVDVISVRKGAWKVQDQWDPKGPFTVPLSDLAEIWPNTETLDTIDEFLKEGYELVEVYNIIMLITGTQEWAQLLMIKWADLY